MTTSLLSRLSDNHPLSAEDNPARQSPLQDVLHGELKMLLTSRAWMPDIENIPLLNTSVLNYGIDDAFRQIPEINARQEAIERRLKNVIERFEPRLSRLSLSSRTDNAQNICISLRGHYSAIPVALELTWNDCSGSFWINE